MTDTTEPTTETCMICGAPAMLVLDVATVLGGQGQYTTCPYHVDSVIARCQDAIHADMVMQEGALIDWWNSVQPQPEQLEPEDEDITEEYDVLAVIDVDDDAVHDHAADATS